MQKILFDISLILFFFCSINDSSQVTHAKWWGAPGPLFCGPKSQYPHTGYWDFSYECNNKWANPPEYCDAYEGQKGGKHIDDAPYANAAGRTDVEGCCWWGRGGRLQYACFFKLPNVANNLTFCNVK